MSPCPKCGSEQFQTKFIKKGSVVTPRSYSAKDGCDVSIEAAKDHLLITCQNCHYSHRTKTLDDKS